MDEIKEEIKEALFTMFFVVLGGLGLYVVSQFAVAGGEIEFCYIAPNESKPCLLGSVYWRPDERIICDEKIENLIESAKMLECSLNRPKKEKQNDK